MAMMVVAAAGMSSTVVLTAMPMPMARAAAMTICTADPAVMTGVHHGFLGSGAVSPVCGVPLVDVVVRCTSSMAVFSVDMMATVVGMVVVTVTVTRPSQNQACLVRRGLRFGLGEGGGERARATRFLFHNETHGGGPD
jgi:hypothetical protein